MSSNSFNGICMNRIKSSLTKCQADFSDEFSLTNPNVVYQMGEMK